MIVCFQKCFFNPHLCTSHLRIYIIFEPMQSHSACPIAREQYGTLVSCVHCVHSVTIYLPFTPGQTVFHISFISGWSGIAWQPTDAIWHESEPQNGFIYWIIVQRGTNAGVGENTAFQSLGLMGVRRQFEFESHQRWGIICYD